MQQSLLVNILRLAFHAMSGEFHVDIRKEILEAIFELAKDLKDSDVA